MKRMYSFIIPTILFLILFIAVSQEKKDFSEVLKEINVFYPVEGDIEMSIATDKQKYLICEPVTLIVTYVNKTDKQIIFGHAKYDNYFKDYKIEVIPPKNESSYIDGKKDDAIQNNVPATRFHNTTPVWSGSSGGAMQPHCKSIVKIPLSQYLDFSFPWGTYTINMERRYGPITFKGTTTFEIVPQSGSSSSITIGNMMSMLGRKKAMELLGDEAESILVRMEEDKVEDIEKSPEYGRLMMILRTLDEGSYHLSFDHRLKFLEENNRMSVKELRGFVRICQGRERP